MLFRVACHTSSYFMSHVSMLHEYRDVILFYVAGAYTLLPILPCVNT